MKLEYEGIATISIGQRHAPSDCGFYVRADKRLLALDSKHSAGSSGTRSGHETGETTHASSKRSAGPAGTSLGLGSESETNANSRPECASPRSSLFRNRMPAVLNSSSKACSICASDRGFVEIIARNLNRKRVSTRDSYNTKSINDIVYNESTHIVSVFKDWLIYDDTSEFLKQSYSIHELFSLLKKQTEYYDKYSMVFPNYYQLDVKEYMFKNIKRKQKAIDGRQGDVERVRAGIDAGGNSSDSSSRLFTTRFLDELNRPDSILGRSQHPETSETLMQSYMKSQVAPRRPAKAQRIEDMELQDLVDRFMSKDSISFFGQDIDCSSSRCNNRSKAKETRRHTGAQIIKTDENFDSTNRPRSKSRNGLTQEDCRPAKQDRIHVVAVEKPKPAPAPACPHVDPSRVLLSARSRSTGKFLINVEPPQTSRAPREDLQATIVKMLEKTAGRRAMLRRSKSGLTGEVKFTAGGIPAESNAKPAAPRIRRQRTVSIFHKDDIRLVKGGGIPTARTIQVQSPALAVRKSGDLFLRGPCCCAPGFCQSTTSCGKRTATAAGVHKIVTGKGLAIDIESINKCLQKQKSAAIQEAKTLMRTSKASAKLSDGKKTPDYSSHQFRSGYLNALKTGRLRPPTAMSTRCPTPMELAPVQTSKGRKKLAMGEGGCHRAAEIVVPRGALKLVKEHIRRKSGADVKTPYYYL